ncbi:hypothetical protein E8L99_16020 [Phreatobacter aquaticus]|uniref:Uncharacterized protein n=1 Tax=Phreatobacter aquaticus TaxID=2570229 RepID=A0A4D7QNH5_9HYPH|nr:hypothetical protein [Phreatobacter aquaticus]QCK87159.1 hypothetical protein E8L99_16020 [Phreatobacter aquaticus]
MHEKWDDPEINWRVVRALLILAPFLFTGTYLLSLAQRASSFHSLIIAGIALGMCLGSAAIIHLFRSGAGPIFAGIAVAIGLLGALLGR